MLDTRPITKDGSSSDGPDRVSCASLSQVWLRATTLGSVQGGLQVRHQPLFPEVSVFFHVAEADLQLPELNLMQRWHVQ